ncbi:MAG: hypothetical protein NDI94_05025 [Candidatus Woesearchaeota archaeon]|nr:hypothetical protein [Candidatus Woesearchaeota archaeon]
MSPQKILNLVSEVSYERVLNVSVPIGWSLSEIASTIDLIVQKAEKNHGLKNGYNLIYPLNSRGNIPFALALEQLSNLRKKDPSRINFDLTVVPHIFSIDYIMAHVDQLDNTLLEGIYDQLASRLGEKIQLAIKPDQENIVLDIDEVIQGDNRLVRTSIYSKLNLSGLPFYIASCISDKGEALNRKLHSYFEEKVKDSSDLFAINTWMNHPISWSDNADFYKSIGVTYLPIYSPIDKSFKHILKHSAHASFYMNYFYNVGELLADYFSIHHQSLAYHLLRTDERGVNLLRNMSSGYLAEICTEAFVSTLSSVFEEEIKDADLFNRKKDKFSYIYHPNDDTVYFERSGSKFSPVLMRMRSDGYNQHNPLILLYEPIGESSNKIHLLIRDYLTKVRLSVG